MDTQEGPRKRRRSDAALEDTDASESTICVALDDEPIVRDARYYREDGDCVIQVGRVLFKIHRFLLERDSSAFSNMFSMPQENEKFQAMTDENPLVLYDEVDEFRALCWIMYALPKVYMKQLFTSSPEIEKLVSLYLIAHKYHFESHESFARFVLQRHGGIYASTSITQDYFTQCTESRFQTVLRIATLTKSAPLEREYVEPFSTALQRMWIYRLKHTKESIAYALEVGEALGLRSFVGDLYYLQLTRLKAEVIADSSAYALPLNDDLAPHQKLALYQGNWSLRHYWSKIREEAPQKTFKCSHQLHDCQEAWSCSWDRSKLRESSSPFFDPRTELKNVKKDISTITGYDCADIAISEMILDLKTNICIHFLGPPPTAIADPESSSSSS